MSMLILDFIYFHDISGMFVCICIYFTHCIRYDKINLIYMSPLDTLFQIIAYHFKCSEYVTWLNISTYYMHLPYMGYVTYHIHLYYVQSYSIYIIKNSARYSMGLFSNFTYQKLLILHHFTMYFTFGHFLNP